MAVRALNPIQAAWDNANFGARIRQLRLAKGWSQYELAAAIGMDRCRLSDWERGAALPSLLLYARMLDALDIKRDPLLKALPSVDDTDPDAAQAGGG